MTEVRAMSKQGLGQVGGQDAKHPEPNWCVQHTVVIFIFLACNCFLHRPAFAQHFKCSCCILSAEVLALVHAIHFSLSLLLLSAIESQRPQNQAFAEALWACSNSSGYWSSFLCCIFSSLSRYCGSTSAPSSLSWAAYATPQRVPDSSWYLR